MVKILDTDIIYRFREKVDENDFVLHNYKEKYGKVQWNCICSAMDWIDVTIDYINSDWNISTNANINIKCMNFYTYISSIDIMWEAIQQLHRIFFDVKQIPFIGECKYFPNQKYDKDDNAYFKTIRACFGAHPINLSDPIHKENSKMKRYASWPIINDKSQKGDFSVHLYSNQLNVNDIYLSVYLEELGLFALKRYEYLNVLIQIIDEQHQKFLHTYKEKIINRKDDYLEQVNILLLESKERLDDSYYTEIVEKLLIIFETKTHSDKNKILLEYYKVNLRKVIDEIYRKLQNMEFGELCTDSIIDPSPGFKEGSLRYSLEKLSNAVRGGGSLHSQGAIESYLSGIVDFSSISSLEERYTLTYAGLYWKNKNNKQL